MITSLISLSKNYYKNKSKIFIIHYTPNFYELKKCTLKTIITIYNINCENIL